uniref:Lethal giant larvae homologue 2 domain-containing protein n=1 Tax=Caenorhabditis japonica TaxID=281687 RepID=A0A8R1HMW6_CAEJA
MSKFLQYIRSQFYIDNSETVFKDYIEFDEGNRGGFPSDIVAFNYHNGLVVVATSTAQVIFYGYNGASWSINLNSQNTSSSSTLQVNKICFVSSNTVFVLCHGPIIVPLQITDGIVTKLEEVKLETNSSFRWDFMHIQEKSDSENYLIYCLNNTIFRVMLDAMQPETLLTNEDIMLWTSGGGEISSITSLPKHSSSLLVIDKNGTVAYYNKTQFIMTVTLKNFEDEPIIKLCWCPNSPEVAYGISCNNKYSKWKITIHSDNRIRAQEINFDTSHNFGPYPCHEIKHFSICPDVTNDDQHFLIYQGGKSSGKNDDRDLLSFRHGDYFEKLELLSSVVGIANVDNCEEKGKNGFILICTKCEIIGIDLDKQPICVLQPRHFLSINISNPTAHGKVIEIEENIWDRIITASQNYWESNGMSSRDWPIFYQKNIVVDANKQRAAYRQVYISGHSNGNVCIWSTGGVNMSLLLVVRTSLEFETNSSTDNDSEYNYPNVCGAEKPVKKMGMYDPFDDEEELHIKLVTLDSKSGSLIVCNRGGYILLYDMNETPKKLPPWEPISTQVSNLTVENTKNKLKPRKTELEYSCGFHLRHRSDTLFPLVFNVNFNHKIRSIAFFHKYQCLAVGGSFGFTCMDVKHGYLVYSKSYNDPSNTSNIGSSQLQRYRSLKKSLRRTFRKKRKPVVIENSSHVESTEPTFENAINNEINKESYVERPIETKTDSEMHNDPQSRQVTCIKILRFPLEDEKRVDDVLAVGLNNGTVYFYTVTEHDVGLRMTFNVEQIKTIAINRKQPILNIDITNDQGYFSASTKLIVITDEELRVYNCLPMLKRNSYKITALEGLKIRNGAVTRLSNKKVSNSYELFALLLTNNGNLRIHSTSKPAVFETRPFIDSTDAIAMDSICLSRDGDSAYLIKSSELQRSTINGHFRGWKVLRNNNTN